MYVGGCGRSGSTLLDRMLGQLPGVAAVGELYLLVQRGLVDDEVCGCGEVFSRCPFWTEVLDRTIDGNRATATADLASLQHRVDRNRHIPAMGGRDRRPAVVANHQRYAAFLGRLYGAIADVSGCRVVVDSSKHVSTAWFLREVDSVDLAVVHLVRDSRGMAYSWTKAVARPEARTNDAEMDRYPPSRSAARWLLYNLAFEALARSDTPTTRVRYEDLVTDPHGQLGRILDGAGLDDLDRTFAHLGADGVELAFTHSVAGNPMRFQSGRLTLELDEVWRTRMPSGQRRLVTAMTAPMLGAYGYGRWSRR